VLAVRATEEMEGGSGFVTRYGRVVMTILGLALKDGLMSLTDPVQQHHPSLGIPPNRTRPPVGWTTSWC
jgi:hypothetical protein